MARISITDRACRDCGVEEYQAWQCDPGVCIPCKQSRTKQWRKDNRDRDYARKAQWDREARAKDPKKWWAQRTAINTRSRAKRDGLSYDLDRDFLYSVAVDTCPVLGTPIDYTLTVVSPNSPSVDRFNAGEGYTKENVNIISNRANVIKQDATWQELAAVTKWVKELTNETAVS